MFFVIMPLVYICTILPFSLGGLGVREGALVYLLAKMGVPASDGVALSFLIYINPVLVDSVGGILHVLKNSKKIVEPHEMNKRL